MDIGLSTYSFPWAVGIPGSSEDLSMGAAALIHKAMQRDIHHVQIGDNMPLHLMSHADLLDLRHLSCKAGVQLEVGTAGLFPDNLMNYLQISRIFQSPFLRIVIDAENFQPTARQAKETIKEVLPFFRREGIRLALENHDRFPSPVLKEIVDQTDSDWVGICLDTANSFGCGESVRETVSVLAPYTINLHVKDFSIRRVPSRMGFTIEGCAAGAGMLDISWLLKEVSGKSKCQTATLELWSPFINTLEETICREAEWAESSLIYLTGCVKDLAGF